MIPGPSRCFVPGLGSHAPLGRGGWKLDGPLRGAGSAATGEEAEPCEKRAGSEGLGPGLGSGSGGGEEAEACADGHACGGDAAAGVGGIATVVADVIGLAPCEDEEDEACEGGGDPEEGAVFADSADGFAETFGEGGWEFWRHGGQATMSVMTLPPSTISMGRAPGAMSSLSELMPSWW